MLMNETRNLLYPWCIKIFSLIFLVKLMQFKVINNWSNKSFNMLLKLLKDAFPIHTTIRGSFYNAKRKLCDLGLGYNFIHSCKYACVLLITCRNTSCCSLLYRIMMPKRRKSVSKCIHYVENR